MRSWLCLLILSVDEGMVNSAILSTPIAQATRAGSGLSVTLNCKQNVEHPPTEALRLLQVISIEPLQIGTQGQLSICNVLLHACQLQHAAQQHLSSQLTQVCARAEDDGHGCQGTCLVLV